MVIEDIKEFGEVYNDALVLLRDFVKERIPNRSVLKAENDKGEEISPYVTFRTLSTRYSNPSSYGNDPIRSRIYPDGSCNYVYSYTVPIILNFRKGEAFVDANRVVQSLKNDNKHYLSFGSRDDIGVVGVELVDTANTPIDQQGWETGATVSVTISFLAREYDAGLSFIENVGEISPIIK